MNLRTDCSKALQMTFRSTYILQYKGDLSLKVRVEFSHFIRTTKMGEYEIQNNVILLKRQIIFTKTTIK